MPLEFQVDSIDYQSSTIQDSHEIMEFTRYKIPIIMFRRI